MSSPWVSRLPSSWAGRCSEGGLMQEMKVVCLGYHRNRGVKLSFAPAAEPGRQG